MSEHEDVVIQIDNSTNKLDTNKSDTNKLDTNKLDTNKLDTNKLDTNKIIKKPNNGWSYEHDELLAIWGDKAGCYTWMHDATQRKFKSINMKLGIPIIVLSTVSGTANFGISTIFPPGFNYGNAVIGCLSLITGVLSTVANFLGYAQSEEAHRIASIQWAKFKRSIETELALSPLERTDATEFIKHSRNELDRLMEQNPIIPQEIIDRFKRTFRKNIDVKMPEICNKLDHTFVYTKRNSPTDPKSNIDRQISELVGESTTEKSIINNVEIKLNSLIEEKNKKKPFNPLVNSDTVKLNIPNESSEDDISDTNTNNNTNSNVINYNNTSNSPKNQNIKLKINPKKK
jgi:hypothetical protein